MSIWYIIFTRVQLIHIIVTNYAIYGVALWCYITCYKLTEPHQLYWNQQCRSMLTDASSTCGPSVFFTFAVIDSSKIPYRYYLLIIWSIKHTYAHTHTRRHVDIHTHTYTSSNTSTQTHAHSNTKPGKHPHRQAHKQAPPTHTHTHTHTQEYPNAHTHLHTVHTPTHTYTHTHAHTPLFPGSGVRVKHARGQAGVRALRPGRREVEGRVVGWSRLTLDPASGGLGPYLPTHARFPRAPVILALHRPLNAAPGSRTQNRRCDVKDGCCGR